MGRRTWAATRLAVGAAILGVLVWRLGTGPFIDGVRRLTVGPVLSVAGITAATTVCCAWRWSVVARALGADLPLRAAVPACYRSQLLNSALPGGVVGDVHRGMQQGRESGNVGRGLRAVVWERAAGQLVQGGIAAAVLLLPASPVRSAVPPLLLALGVVAVLLGAAARGVRRRRPSRVPGFLEVVHADLRHGLLSRRTWPAVTVASGLVVAGHTGTFLVAARAAGVTASAGRLYPLAILVLLAMAVPVSVGGWGPREGVAAWAFGAAGLGAANGVAAATAYGVLTLVAALPGVVVLVAGALPGRAGRRTAGAHRPAAAPLAGVVPGAAREGVAHG